MRVFKCLPLLFLLFILGACDAFEKTGDINDYVGDYVIEISREKTYHVYWNQKTLTNEKSIDPPSGTSIVITSDKKVQYTTKDGAITNGRVKCLEKYVRFIGMPINSTYKFYNRNGQYLEYSHESTHLSVEYDVTYRQIRMVKQ